MNQETIGDDFLDDILSAEKKLKSGIPEIAEQLEEMESPDNRRAYYVVQIRGSANTKRDLKKMIEAEPLTAGEYIIQGREVAVSKKIRVEYEFV